MEIYCSYLLLAMLGFHNIKFYTKAAKYIPKFKISSKIETI